MFQWKRERNYEISSSICDLQKERFKLHRITLSGFLNVLFLLHLSALSCVLYLHLNIHHKFLCLVHKVGWIFPLSQDKGDGKGIEMTLRGNSTHTQKIILVQNNHAVSICEAAGKM